MRPSCCTRKLFSINTPENHKADKKDDDNVIESADDQNEKILPVDEIIQDKSDDKADEDDDVIVSADDQNEKILPVNGIIQREIKEVQPGFGTTGKTILMMVIDDKETDQHIEAHGRYIRDGILRQNNEIKMLKNRMEQLEKLDTNLKKKK
ncbi:uncharacterized protein LOC122851848 [Aphidius gifuensis]|uniref:uncharacterized protein LOC122851848 n=1 Tax=Aphidius gifuensis TaxID=684658 RepID=UPI001CDB565B|nr:uncharacterized protein LOC122851848 [Aphidius gifuensis]